MNLDIAPQPMKPTKIYVHFGEDLPLTFPLKSDKYSAYYILRGSFEYSYTNIFR